MSDNFHHLAGAYALDALEPQERRNFEAHYTECDICTAEVDGFRTTAALLAERATTDPPPGLKADLMAEVAATRQVGPELASNVLSLSEHRFSSRNTVSVLSAAAAVIVVLGSLFLFRDTDRLSTPDELLASPNSFTTALDGDVGSVTVVWSTKTDEVALIATDLPDPGPGNAYALWFLTDDGVVPAGLFDATSGTVSTVISVADVDGTGWGITIEPDTGSDQPTSDILFIGEV